MSGDSLKVSVSRNEKTSDLVKRVLAELTGEKNIPIGLILYRLRRRSFGGILILLATLSLIPGVSVLTGILMVLIAVQMTAGLRAPFLPRVFREREISIEQLKSVGNKILPWVEWAEQYIEPRWSMLTSPPFTHVLGLIVLTLALMVTIPLPFSNFLPSIALLLLAFGILERDGILIVIGFIVASIALLIGGLVTMLAISGITNLIG